MLKETRYRGSLISNSDEFRFHARGTLTISQRYQSYQTYAGDQDTSLIEERIHLVAHGWTFKPLRPKATREFPALFRGTNVNTGRPLFLDYLLWVPCPTEFDIDKKEIELIAVIPAGRSLPEPLP